MSYTSTSVVERIGTCSIVGLSGIAFASAMIADQNSSKSGGRTVVVPNWSAGPLNIQHRDWLGAPKEPLADHFPQRLDDDLFLAGLHGLGVDDDTVRRSARAGRFEEEDARVVLLERHHQLVRVDAALGSEHQLDPRHRMFPTIMQVPGGDVELEKVVQPLQHP